MNLLCPHCQRQLQVPEQYAGTLMKCPICEKTFTVPVLPSMPAAAAPPPPPPPPSSYQASAPSAPAAAFQKSASSAPPAGYHHTRSLLLSPRLAPMVAPVCLLIVFFLMFFTWDGLYPTAAGIVTQSGWEAAIGGASFEKDWNAFATGDDKLLTDYFGTDVKPLKEPGMSFFLLLFALVLLAALALAIANLGIAFKLIPLEPPPALQSVWAYRSLLVAALALGAYVLLALSSLLGFPLQERAAAQADSIVEAKKEKITSTADKLVASRWEIEKGVRVGGMRFQTTMWFSMAMYFSFLAVIGAGLSSWLDTRAATPPPPKLDIVW